jgi:ubiquitin-protein ligase
MTNEINLRVYTQGGEETQIETPANMPASEFVNELAAALDLPARDVGGHPVPWRLDNKDTGRTVDLARTLEENGVRSGHRLSLIREVTAGSGHGVSICAPDGSRRTFPIAVADAESLSAPPEVLSAFGYREDPGSWVLLRSGHQSFALARTTVAGAGSDRRQDRLKVEYDKLMSLNDESDNVVVRAVERPGSVAEEYEVTFKCRGLAGIDSSRNPLYSEQHVVKIVCGEEFPSQSPRLAWVTPIWHPNIHHVTKQVCTNTSEWLGGMTVLDVCRQLFDMVQYKNYHAESTPPRPLDGVVAEWVLSYAEPNGIVNKRRGIYTDDRPFTRPARVRIIAAKASAQSSQVLRIAASPSSIKIVRKSV